MKIKKVQFNNRKKVFVIETAKTTYDFPYAKAQPMPKKENYVKDVYVDKELGNEGFTYILVSGKEGTLHIDHVLEYHQDPEYMMDLLSYNLSVALEKCLETSNISKREIVRRLNSSPTQLYRLLDPSTSKRSIGQKLKILHLLDCDIELNVKDQKGCKILECSA